VLVLILLLGACAGSLLYCLRFFRWRSVAIMWNAGLPRIKKLGGKWGGQEIGVELDERQEVGLEALKRRVNDMEVTRAVDRELLDQVVRALLQKEAQYDTFDRGTPPGIAGGGEGTMEDQ
jgi:hypothetical protein